MVSITAIIAGATGVVNYLSRFDWVSILKDVMKVVAGTMGFVTFSEWFGEEALQSAAMGVWTLISGKQWDEASKQLADYEIMVDQYEQAVITFGWLSPLFRPSVDFYIRGAREQIESYKRIIGAQGTPGRQPEPIMLPEELKEELPKKAKRWSKTFVRNKLIYYLSKVELTKMELIDFEAARSMVSEKYFYNLFRLYGTLPMIQKGYEDEFILALFPEDHKKKAATKLKFHRKYWVPFGTDAPTGGQVHIAPREAVDIKVEEKIPFAAPDLPVSVLTATQSLPPEELQYRAPTPLLAIKEEVPPVIPIPTQAIVVEEKPIIKAPEPEPIKVVKKIEFVEPGQIVMGKPVIIPGEPPTYPGAKQVLSRPAPWSAIRTEPDYYPTEYKFEREDGTRFTVMGKPYYLIGV